MSADAVRFDLKVKPGDPLNPKVLQGEFRRFWNRGYFSDLTFRARCTVDGGILMVHIAERPTIISIEYDKVKQLNQQQIEDYFAERNFVLAVGRPMDRKKLWRAATLVSDMLGQKGYLDAEVTWEQVAGNADDGVRIRFNIDPGVKTRIRKMEFTGNEAFSDRTLRSKLKLTRAHRWYWPFSKKSLYHPMKFQQDLNKVLEFYRDHGYLDVRAKPPIVDIQTVRKRKAEKKAQKRQRRAAEKAARRREKAERKGKLPEDPYEAKQEAEESARKIEEAGRVKERKWVYLTVPIDEGPAYKLGKVTFEGNSGVVEEKHLRTAFTMVEGDVLADNRVEFGVELVQAFYGSKGYIYASVTPRYERREGEAVADLVIEINEDEAYKVRRIDFEGNKTTHDEVLRREMNIDEGKLLNRTQLRTSMRKLQLLGYWLPTGEPTLEPVRGGEAQVDVRVHGEENSRNEVQVGGGYSELEGGFFLASYRTRNFLGRGETLSVSVAVGGRANRTSLEFIEPWFMGRPYTFGFRVFQRSFDFGRGLNPGGGTRRLTQTSVGGSLTLGRRLNDWSQFQIRYGIQSVEADVLDLSQPFGTDKIRIGTLTPLYYYSNKNDLYRPTQGFEISLAPQLAAEFLGGDTNYWKPRIDVKAWRPLFGKLFVGARAEVAWIDSFGTINRDPGRNLVDGVPQFERFFLGGDRIGPRVFETRTISPIRRMVRVNPDGTVPVDLAGNPQLFDAFVGGSKSALFQLEVGMTVGKAATVALFFDAGGVYDNGVNIGREGMRSAAGVEFRVFLPVFQAPIRLIYGVPLQQEPGDRTNAFQFSIGTPF